MHGATVSDAMSAPLAAFAMLPLMTLLSAPLFARGSDPAAGRLAEAELALLSTELSIVWWLETGVRELDIDFMVLASEGFAVRMLFATAAHSHVSALQVA